MRRFLASRFGRGVGYSLVLLACVPTLASLHVLAEAPGTRHDTFGGGAATERVFVPGCDENPVEHLDVAKWKVIRHCQACLQLRNPHQMALAPSRGFGSLDFVGSTPTLPEALLARLQATLPESRGPPRT